MMTGAEATLAPARATAPATTSPLVSFIIPAFNAARTLGATLDSVVAQRFADWEAVIVDDGSRDRSFALARRRVAAEPRFRPFRQANGGASRARNTALAQARGRWIAFLDADDWIAPDFLSTLLGLLDGKGDDHVAYCSYVRITPTGEPTPPDWCPELQEDAFGFLSRRCEPAIHCVLVSRKLVLAVGGFDTDLVNCEDWDLWLKVARTGATFVGTPAPLAFYRMRAGSLSTLDRTTERNSRIVMERALGPDPRVADPHPRYATGLGAGVQYNRDLASAVAASAIALAEGAPPPAEFAWAQALADPAEQRRLLEHGPDWNAVALRLAAASGTKPPQIGLADLMARLAPLRDAIEPFLPGHAEKMRDDVAAELIALSPLDTPRREGTVLGIRLDISRPLPRTTAMADASTLLIKVEAGSAHLFWTDLPAFGDISGAQIARAVIQQSSVRDLLGHGRLLRRTCFWTAGGSSLPRLLADAARSPGGPRAKLRRLRLAVADAVRAGMAQALAGRTSEIEDERAAETIAAAAAATLRDVAPPAVPLCRDSDDEPDIDSDRQAYWERIFADGDPWDYDNPYEAEKYRRTLSLIPAGPVASAIELACAEGHFTRLLGQRVDRLLAADISERALERAARRCADLDTVRFTQLDFFAEPIPGTYDLVVCSEVLYFAETEQRLAGIVDKLAGAVAPGGMLLTAHAYVVDDDPGRTGFDWGNGVGATAVDRAIQAVPDMRLERAIETELYRISLFRKAIPGEPPTAAGAVEKLPITAALGPELERYIVRGGAAVTRVQVAHERCEESPVLYFSKLVEQRCGHLDDAMDLGQFDELIAYLRRNGYRASSFAELAALRCNRSATFGRPIVLAFDDCDDDFAERLLPRIQRSGFAAELLVPAARLLDPAGRDRLRTLQNESVGIALRGEVLPADPRAWLEQAAKAKAALTGLLAAEAAVALLPVPNNRDLVLLGHAGFDLVTMPGAGFVRLAGTGRAIPVIECTGQESLGMMVETLRSSG